MEVFLSFWALITVVCAIFYFLEKRKGGKNG